MLQIFIYGKNENGFLDMQEGTILDMENYTPLFDEDLSAGEFSLPVDLPWTEKNRRLLGFAERMQNWDDIIPYWVVDVYDKGFPELVHAKITLLEKSGDFGFNRGSFSASISGNKGLFGTSIKNKTLRNIPMGDTITWSGKDSRSFATDHAKGMYPQHDMIMFAPLVNENFFDTNKNYNGEFLVNDTLNNVVKTGNGVNAWKFARPTSANEAIATIAGDVEHIDYRTVPFFKFQYVLAKAFEAGGITAKCDIISNPNYADIFLFNNVAIDFMSTATYADYNTSIIPSNHMPDMSLVDFFRSVFSFFNLFPVFTSKNSIEVYYREQVFINRKVLDITARCNPFFSGTYADAADNNGYKMEYTWDGADDYINDRVKEIDEADVVATVATLPLLGTLNIGRSFTTDDIAYVVAENMYYKVANATLDPVLWDAYAEKLNAYTTGTGDRSVEVGMGTLCNYVKFDEDRGLYVRDHKLCTRQAGTYINNKYVTVKNDFSLRIFYITKRLVNTNLIPISTNHNVMPDGVTIAPVSLALTGADGIAAKFHQKWQALKSATSVIQVTVLADARLMKELEDNNTIKIDNVLYLVSKIERSIPLANTINMELIPI